jgi:hypothetical protein
MVEALSRLDARLSAAGRLCSAPLRRALLLSVVLFVSGAQAAFDHSHAKFDTLLQRHVVWTRNGVASEVDYAAINRDRSLLRDYLAEVAAVTNEEYRDFTRSEQLAFLINAYNAYTIDFVLTKYPDIDSIRDLGSLFNSPWKKRFFPLLGEKRSLDEIEHGMIRKPGDFDEPRIHMAVNCASVSCPALRDEAFVSERLDTQLEDSVRRFLGDSSRNRADENGLWVSKIFDWYAVDFKKQAGSVAKWLAAYAEQLSNDPKIRAGVASASLRIRHLDYEWALNDRRNPS